MEDRDPWARKPQGTGLGSAPVQRKRQSHGATTSMASRWWASRARRILASCRTEHEVRGDPVNASSSATQSPGAWVAGLQRSVGRLAAPAEQQLAYLAELGVAPSVDELGLEFEDFYIPVCSELTGLLDWKPALAALAALDSALGSNQLTWDVDSLTKSQDWERIRQVAAVALQMVDKAVSATRLVTQRTVSTSKPIF